jgi:two-component system response regulator HydG
VRELQNAVERAVVVCRGNRIEAEHFPFAGGPREDDLTLDRVEEAHVRRMLAASGFNVTRAAKLLNIDRVTLYNKMKKYGISKP